MIAATRYADRRAAMRQWLDDERVRRAVLLPPNARCAECGEYDPLVLVPDHRRILCADHDAQRRGQTPMQLQHIAGQQNGPWVVYVSANRHRRLTVRERLRMKYA
ncbi:MAG: hypothetical protein WAK16_06505 [Candidatus Cybelea sp.]